MEYEVIDGEEVNIIINGGKIERKTDKTNHPALSGTPPKTGGELEDGTDRTDGADGIDKE